MFFSSNLGGSLYFLVFFCVAFIGDMFFTCHITNMAGRDGSGSGRSGGFRSIEMSDSTTGRGGVCRGLGQDLDKNGNFGINTHQQVTDF